MSLNRLNNAQIEEIAQKKYHTLRARAIASILAYVDTVPKAYRRVFLEAHDAETNSKTASIKAKCLDCVGYESVQKEIGGCKVRICPLWKWRPYQ